MPEEAPVTSVTLPVREEERFMCFAIKFSSGEMGYVA
jgi:hypothetical protein